MSEQSEVVAALTGTGWKVGVDQNPHTGLWHWIAWQGSGTFADPEFVKLYNEGIKRPGLPTRDEAIEVGVGYALDQHAGMVEVSIEGLPDVGG